MRRYLAHALDAIRVALIRRLGGYPLHRAHRVVRVVSRNDQEGPHFRLYLDH